MPSKKKRFSRSKRFNHTIRRNKNKLKKIQTGGTNSDILVETESGTWVNARPYQKKAFRDFIQRYKTGLTFSNNAGNFNPENNYTYDKDGIKFTVVGEIYIVKDNGSRMRIKSVLRPEGSPEPDYDNEAPPGPNDKYFFSTSEGEYYFNNTINEKIAEQKKEFKHFMVDGKYEFFLSPQEIQIQGQAINNIGSVRINGSYYQLYYSFICLPPNDDDGDYSTTKPSEVGTFYYVVDDCNGMKSTYYFSPAINRQISDGRSSGGYNHSKVTSFMFGTRQQFNYNNVIGKPATVTMFGKTLELKSYVNN